MIASDFMTENVVTVAPDASLREAIELLQTLDIRHLPVVQPSGEIVGILSDRDIRNSSTPYTHFAAEAGTHTRVSAVMSTDVVVVNPASDLDEIIDLMLEYRIGALPVVDTADETLVGIVSYVDVLRAIRDERA